MTTSVTYAHDGGDVIAPSRWRARAVLLLGTFVFFAYGYDLYALQTVAPSLLSHPSWHVTPGTLGMLGSVTALGEMIGAFVAGPQSDVHGRRTPIVICVGWISGCMLLSGLASSLLVFGLSRFLLGIGLGALCPLVCALVVDWARVRRRSLYCGFALSAIPLGGVAAASGGRAFLTGVDFRWMFLIGVLPILLVPVYWSLIPVDVPAEASLPDRATRRDAPVVSREWWALFEPGWLLASVLFCIASFIGMLLIYGTSSWLPTLMTEQGYDVSSTLEVVIAFNCGAVVGTLLFSMAADWIPVKSCVAVLFLCSMTGLRALTAVEGHLALLETAALAGAGIMGAQNVIDSYVARYYSYEVRGTALGMILGVGRFGSLIGPSFLTVLTAVNSDPKAGFFPLVTPALIGAVVIFLVPRGRRRSKRLKAA
ncbi:MFS transporter [Streptomyces sp. NPDC020801]|uniref:MFS transporter n=1 Tax=unclassified Streptomyces TaxID=2593676 RepID=UPI0037996BB5